MLWFWGIIIHVSPNDIIILVPQCRTKESFHLFVPLIELNPSPNPVNFFLKNVIGSSSTSLCVLYCLYSNWTFMFICEVVSSMKAWIFPDFLPLLYHYCVAHNDYSIYTCLMNKWEATLNLKSVYRFVQKWKGNNNYKKE